MRVIVCTEKAIRGPFYFDTKLWKFMSGSPQYAYSLNLLNTHFMPGFQKIHTKVDLSFSSIFNMLSEVLFFYLKYVILSMKGKNCDQETSTA